MQVAAVVGARTRIEGQVGKFAEIAITPGRHSGGDAGGNFSTGRAGEAGQVKGVPLQVREVEVGDKGGKLVKAGLVIGVACEVRLPGSLA